MNYYGFTDKGKIRKSNQDRFLITCSKDGSLLLAAVCDGMGGASGGETASSIAVNTVESAFSDFCEKGEKVKNCGTFLTDAVSKANRSIYNVAVQTPSLEGMGTTFVGFIACKNKITIANVGDSRAYHISEDGITQLTTDHSLINEMIQQGSITPLEAVSHPVKNVITRALGVEPSVKCDTYTAEIKSGEYILLCSDGLTEAVSEPEIHFEVCTNDSVEAACKSLADIANSRGGHDNITIVICAF
ncbi:MAG: Stp1/IreP family PP2C-type Ser/Thr phosphatase [Clostridia bacterium]|nr:Stp1/IreP family PP2C-type Ser/Thr phosphatase [Clostridia bacterium]